MGRLIMVFNGLPLSLAHNLYSAFTDGGVCAADNFWDQ